MDQTIQQPAECPIISIDIKENIFDRNVMPSLTLINMTEEFRFINSYTFPNIIPERYLISNFGRVYDRLYGQFIDFIPDQDNYPSFVINYFLDWNIIDRAVIHVCDAVMRTFNLIPEYNTTYVRHIDGNKNHFKLKNLEWFDPDGLPNHLVETICSRLQTGCLITQLVEMFDIPRSVIEDIRDGKRYMHIRRKYKITKRKMNLLTPAQVRHICKILENQPNISSEELADMMDCTLTAIEGVRSGNTYTRISNEYDFERIKAAETRNKVLTEDEVREICETFIRHPELNNFQIANLMKCKPTQVRDIRIRKVHKNIIKDYNW